MTQFTFSNIADYASRRYSMHDALEQAQERIQAAIQRTPADRMEDLMSGSSADIREVANATQSFLLFDSLISKTHEYHGERKGVSWTVYAEVGTRRGNPLEGCLLDIEAKSATPDRLADFFGEAYHHLVKPQVWLIGLDSSKKNYRYEKAVNTKAIVEGGLHLQYLVPWPVQDSPCKEDPTGLCAYKSADGTRPFIRLLREYPDQQRFSTITSPEGTVIFQPDMDYRNVDAQGECAKVRGYVVKAELCYPNPIAATEMADSADETLRTRD